MRRTLLSLALVCSCLGGTSATAAQPLPVGSQPRPVAVPHFPDALHAVVWRNWQLVEPARLARALRATEEDVRRLAASMGLPPVESVQPEWRRRGYITVLRRNWHLLPYEQILTLLDMEADELATALREDDFLYIKLGSSKPRCDFVRWKEPDEAAKRRAAEIKALVEKHFGDALSRPPAEAPFHFVRELSAPPAGAAQAPARPAAAGLRYIYSYFGTFGDPLIDETLNPYPDGLLARLAENGVNGVWLHVVLRQLAPGGPDFPEFGEGHERRLENLRRLVARAKRHGVGVYLYMNEPRAMPRAFFANRPEMAGTVEGDWQAMCTSDARVRRWLADSLAHVFSQVPDLAGVFTISASENFTSCPSHGNQRACPRCKDRRDDEVIAEVNATIAEGVRRGSNGRAKTIVWDWGWRGHGDAADFIARLPKDVWFMSVSEWSQPFERGGIKGAVGEYSMSVVGPGPRATRHWKLAKEAGLKTVAKVQLSCTWELSAVPYLPVMDLVARHCQGLAQRDVDGVMLSWSLGSYPSPNLRVAQRFAEDPNASIDGALEALARDLYGPAGAPHARRAWSAFSAAFSEYPYHGGILYQGPQHCAPANLLHERPTGYQATMVGFPYDDLNAWRGPYPVATFISQMEKVAGGWAEGVEALRRAVEAAPPGQRAFAESDLRIATAAQLHFAATANQARFIAARDERPATAEARDRVRRALAAEIALARAMFDLQRSDSRLGFEASNHYFYVPLDLVEKVISCEHLAARLARQP